MALFVMPSLGADMEAGKLVEWRVAPGDRVRRGDVVAVVETQKGAIEIEIFETGHIEALIAKPGESLPVGAPLARIASDGALPAAPPDAPPPAAPQAAEPTLPPAPPTPAPTVAAPALPASPAARRRAQEAGIDLATVAGSGPGGAVLLADVERRQAEAGPRSEAAPQAVKPGLDPTEMRKAIAAAMSRAKREIPHYYLSHLIDLQRAQDWLAARNADRPPDRRLLMGALLVKATALALQKVPDLNGWFRDGGFAASTQINTGLAISLRGGGLIAPAIADAAALSLDDVMAAMRDLVARTRSGLLRNSELTGGTVTISSMGDGGVDALLGVIYPPQVALVGFGTPRQMPMLAGDRICPRLGVTASLAADHRVSDGRRGARLLTEIDKTLQEPDTL